MPRVRLSHVLVPAPGQPFPFGDAVGVVERPGGDPASRVFVPGWLPCGECARCRRGLVVACSRGRALVPPGAMLESFTAPLDLPDRFLTPLDADGAGLAGEIAAGAGVVATVLDATATTGLSPGDTAVWIGADPLATLGASYCARRGAGAFVLHHGRQAPSRGVPALAAEAGPEGWREALSSPDDRSTGPHARGARLVFLTSSAPEALDAGLAIIEPGSTLALLAPGGVGSLVPAALPPRARLVRLGSYHPDLVPEALALLQRGDAHLELGVSGPGPSVVSLNAALIAPHS